jgi:hypothetical protein
MVLTRLQVITFKTRIMKNKIITGLALILAVSWLFTSCESDMEKAQNDYDASQVIPRVLSVTGPSIGLQTFTYQYGVTYYRAGSTWNWSVEGGTVSSVSADTRTANILFTDLPANDTAYIKVTETTEGGVTSPVRIIKTRVNPYCALVNGSADLVGSWTGDDAYYSSIITTTQSSTNIKAAGIGVGFIEDWWAETVVAGGTPTITININGTVDIPRQFLFTTLYSGDNYNYEIIGSGTWDNCGSAPHMLITYDIYYEGDAVGLAETYASYLDDIPYFTMDITLDDTKSGIPVKVNMPKKPSPRR